MKHNDLTSPEYWTAIQNNIDKPKNTSVTDNLIDIIESFVQQYEGKKLLELGCSPGHMSYLLRKRVQFIPHGIDNAASANKYLELMSDFHNPPASLYKADLRKFSNSNLFDVVVSFGLIEHFKDAQEILDHHFRLCKVGGLIIVSMPNFRYMQWLYHRLFDAADLKKHNIKMMKLETFMIFAKRRSLKIEHLAHAGGIYFWNSPNRKGKLPGLLKIASFFIRIITNKIFYHLLPKGCFLYAPWILFVGRRVKE